MELRTTTLVADKKKIYFSDLSLWLLIITNIATIVLAVIENWSFATILWTYWSQSVIIGSVNVMRILRIKNISNNKISNDHNKDSLKNKKPVSAFFFALHYGFFHFIYMCFLFVVPNDSPDVRAVILASIAFLANHLFSYFYNREADESENINISTLMSRPYKRIIPMHITIIFGPLLGHGALVFFLLLKAIADVFSHISEHKIKSR